MKLAIKHIAVLFLSCLCLVSNTYAQQLFSAIYNINYCASQANKVLKLIPNDSELNMPRNIQNGQNKWKFTTYRDWCSGFWPGELWYLYESTHNKKWLSEADKFTRQLTPIASEPGFDHDLGFQLFNSFGNGYRFNQKSGIQSGYT